MYDEQREAAGEMHFVRMKLREAVERAYPNEDAIQLVRSLGAIIVSEFRTRNCSSGSSRDRRVREGFAILLRAALQPGISDADLDARVLSAGW